MKSIQEVIDRHRHTSIHAQALAHRGVTEANVAILLDVLLAEIERLHKALADAESTRPPPPLLLCPDCPNRESALDGKGE